MVFNTTICGKTPQDVKEAVRNRNKEKKKEKREMFEKLKSVIEEKLNAEGMDITESTRFKEDLEADSLDLFEMVMALEDEFNIEIPSEELEHLLTVGDVMAYLESKGVEA